MIVTNCFGVDGSSNTETITTKTTTTTNDEIRYDDAIFNFCNSPPHHQFQRGWDFFFFLCKLCYNHATMISTIWNYAKYSLATAVWWIQNSVEIEKKTNLKTKMLKENARVFHNIIFIHFHLLVFVWSNMEQVFISLEAVKCAQRKSAFLMAFGG